MRTGASARATIRLDNRPTSKGLTRAAERSISREVESWSLDYLHSAGPAHNLERIFYAILCLKTGRSEIVATTSVGDAVRASNSKGQSDVRADRRLYAPFNGHEPNSLVEGAQRGSTARTRRLERFPFIRYLSIERGQGNSLCSERPCWPRPSESATMRAVA
jgi:hypothetical protein